VQSIAMSVPACLSVRSHIFKTTKFSVHFTCGRGSASSDGSAIRYVLPVLWRHVCL